LPDETTILRFRRLLEEHKLAPKILLLFNELLPKACCSAQVP
jgi:IS5 family transposase